MPGALGAVSIVSVYARAVEDAGARLRELRHEEREDLSVAALALGLAVLAAEVRPSLALPLFFGGLAVGLRGVRAVWRRWDLVERLAGERDAYVLPEVLVRASREATMERRRTFAAVIRNLLRPGPGFEERLNAATDELEALASELEDDALALEPAAAVACERLLNDFAMSPLLDPALPPELLRWRVRQIRSGFSPQAGQRPRAARPTRSPAKSAREHRYQ
jgi:hypothetical protein